MSPAFATVLDITNIILLLSLVMVTIRLLRGPSLPDRAVAGDQIALHVVSFGLVHAIKTDQPFLIDTLIVTAVVGFLSLAVVGIYIERYQRGQAQTQIEQGDKE